MKHIKPLPTIETLDKYLTYDAETGDLRWKEGITYAKQRPAGTAAGTLSKGGYLRVTIEREMYANNRVVWKMVTGRDPYGVIDHIDGNKLNNRFDNLRDTTQIGNVCNAAIRSDNSTGFKGVVLNKGRFTFNLKQNGVSVKRKYFDTPEAANDYVRNAREALHGEYTCHGSHNVSAEKEREI